MGKSSRRRFLAQGAIAGGVLFGADSAKALGERPKYKRKSPASVELMEVGIITCGYYSHIEDIWGIFLNPPLTEKNGTFWPRQTGMVMTTVWDPDPKAAEVFAKKYDVKIAKNYYDMVGKVDGVILSDYYATGWWPQLSKPYLESGMPSLINRPFALSLNEMNEMVNRAKEHNAPILVPSSDETMLETIRARHRVQMLLDKGGHVTGAMAFEPCDEYAAHGVHSIYNLYTILKPNVIAANLIADKWWEWGDKGAMMNWLVKGDGKNPDYSVAIRMSTEADTNGWVEISTNTGRVFENNDNEGDVFTRYRNLFVPTMIDFQKMIETGKQPQTFEHIIGKTTTFLTGFYSHMEKKGAMVSCADVPADWRGPQVMPDRIPNDIFK